MAKTPGKYGKFTTKSAQVDRAEMPNLPWQMVEDEIKGMEKVGMLSPYDM